MAWILREHGPLALKAFAVFACAVLITVSFSQLVQTEAAPADDEDDWRFQESTRRLTVSPGASISPEVAWSPSGKLHTAWADARGGSAGVYHKTSANAGWTFSTDRTLADGFLTIASTSLAVAPRDGLVGVAWEGRSNESSPDQVYVRASPDDGIAWGRAATVGTGRSPALAATGDRLVLAYVHEDAAGDQVRLLTLSVAGGSIRDTRALLAFNGAAASLALVVTGWRAHIAWAEEAQGVAAIAHVSVNLATGVASPVHLVAANVATSAGVSLVGRGDRLALAWSDDSLGTFDIHAAYSGTAGESWITGPPVATGPGNARFPAVAVGARGLVAVVWQDDRTGRAQVFGRVVTLSGTPSTAATRVSDSSESVAEPAVTIGPARDLIVAWSDARDGETEIYADLDALMDRPRLPTIRTYAERLAREDFASPARGSRAQLRQLLQDANDLVEKREESLAIAHLEQQVLPRFDGALGGDPSDDLVVNATAQSELTRLTRGLVDFLRGEAPPGTRVGGGGDDDDDGEPDPPPPGDPDDPPPQPTPTPGDPAGDSPTVSGVAISAITAANAVVTWTVASPGGPVSSSWADWGIASVAEHRTYDNATPFQVTLTPLTTNQTYKVRAGAIKGGTTYLSETFSFYAGVAIAGLAATNLSSDKATIEWTTNVPATSVVLYGRNESNLVSTVTASSGTFHQVNLTGLAAGTYYYRARSAATADATLIGESGTFSIQTGLQIFNLFRKATHVGGAYNVTFWWTTNFQGTSQVRYGLDDKLSSNATGTSGTSHSVTIANLKSSSTYQWQVYSQLVGSTTYACVSSVSNLNFDRQGLETFCTPGETSGIDVSPVVTPPIAIVDVTFTRGQTWIHAKWNTTYASNAVVMWWLGTGPKNVTTVSESTLVHSVNVTGLATATTYKFQLNSTASANGADVARTTAQNVTTKGITISATGAWVSITSAIVNWTTSANATTIVDYGFSYCSVRATVSGYGMSHSVTLTGLLPETTYTYCVRSASQSNPNDVVVDNKNPATGLPRTFKTLPGPNDANTSMDAGSTFATALPVEPGRWDAWVNASAPYSDSKDYYQVYAFAGAQIRATLTVPATHNLNLYSYKPSGSASCSSTSGGTGVGEAITCTVGATEAGYWRLEVRNMSGANRGAYVLDFKVVGGGPEKFTTDVGAANDQNNVVKTPGISIGTSGWGNPATSTVTSTAVDAYKPPASPYPVYRQVTANGTFYLNLYRTSAERYNDYLFTVQYYGTQDSNVSAWNGAGWVTITTVPAQTNWRAFSFTLEHTLFYDAEAGWAGMNVKLRFEKSLQVDLISAMPMRHTTYVGSGSDDAKDEYHMPGIRTTDGWIDQGFGYKNASASGATILVTIPDVSSGYMVRLRFDGNSSGFTVQRCTTCSPTPTWVFATSTSNYTSGEATFVIEPLWYVDAFSTQPGTNVLFRLLPKDRLNETTQFTFTPVHWETNVGVTGDNVGTSHVPGMSVYPNTEWGNPTTVDGRTVRVANLGTTPNLYMNLPWPWGSMIAYVTYKSVNNGLVQLWDGVSWKTVGTVTGGSAWRTDVLFVQGAGLATGGPPSGLPARAFHDDYGDAFVNANLQFTVPVTLDLMWVDVDADADNLTSFGEPHRYAYDDATTHALNPGQAWDVDWFAPVEGRWQFDFKFTSYGYSPPAHYSGALVSVDGTEIGSLRTSVSGAKTLAAQSMLCAENHRLRIYSSGDMRIDVTGISWRKVPTDPDRADTDGDGLRDGGEACAKRTDPTNTDTDADGLTDYDEVYQFFYNNATSSAANVTVNLTVDAAGEYQWRVKTSATVTGGKPTEAVVYLDGQLKWSKKSLPESGWSNVEVQFDANLPKGLHSLQVQRASATGTVTLSLVNVTKPRFTNALFWDTDRDALGDGDELLGHTGWMLSPTKIDTDADGASDGDEVRTMQTDPLLPDTDYDGFNDRVDLDPLHDLVVQLRIRSFSVEGDTGCTPGPCKYWARAWVNVNWTNSPNVTDTDQNGNAYLETQHLLSVNVPDNAAATVKIQVYANNEPNGREIDVAPGTPKTYTTTIVLTAPDRYGQGTLGNEAKHAFVMFDIRVFRVGKANSLLLTPNDWSTLSNGTIDGEPTGLHRYVGENRFVFVLLNVTDGNGNLVSYDLESKMSEGNLADLSGNGLYAAHLGDTPEPGRFGLGARLDGTANSFITTQDPDGKLNDVNDALTVSLWVRPDEDYVDGAEWRWSVGRQNLWRVGYHNNVTGPFHGLRFEVKDSAGNIRSTQAAYPLYAGRWYHLAATLTHRENFGGSTWSDLDLYANGVRIASQTVSPYVSVMDGSTTLRIGLDAASGGRFKGLVDEFRLYTTSLSQDSVRGLAWFLHGANNVIVPRALFYDSQMLQSLNTTSYNGTSAFTGATVYGNDNALASRLNARVIQMVITKNTTLADAWRMMDLGLRNGTNVASAFPLLVTSEFYTLGLATEVHELAANTVVENSGNFSAPPPSPTLWDLFWNTIAGLVSAAWNAVIAVAQFFINLGKWLVEAFVSIVKGLTTGNWTDFENKVLKPIIDALLKFIQFIIDLVVAAVRVVFEALVAPIRDRFVQFAASLGQLALFSRGSFDPTGKRVLWTQKSQASPDFVSGLAILVTVLADVFLFLGILKMVITAVEVGTTIAAATGIGLLIAVAVQIAIIALFSALTQLMMPIVQFVANQLVPTLQATATALAVIALIATIVSFVGPTYTIGVITETVVLTAFPQSRWINDLIRERTLGPTIKPVTYTNQFSVTDQIAGSGKAIALAFASLVVASFSMVLAGSLPAGPIRTVVAVMLDLFAVYLAIQAIDDAFGAPAITTLGPLAKVLAAASLGIAIAVFTADAISLAAEG